MTIKSIESVSIISLILSFELLAITFLPYLSHSSTKTSKRLFEICQERKVDSFDSNFDPHDTWKHVNKPRTWTIFVVIEHIEQLEWLQIDFVKLFTKQSLRLIAISQLLKFVVPCLYIGPPWA
jgi:hypothetical protein